MIALNQREMSVEEFTKIFNNTVKRVRLAKYPSMEFIPSVYAYIPERWYTEMIKMVHMRGINLYPIERYGYIKGILFLKKPCSKFKQLIAWISKHGCTDFSLDNIETKLYVADVCGKRGKWYKEDERRKEYLCHNDTWCDKVKKQLQKVRNTGDKVEVRMETVEDFENMEDSIRNETELYGSVLHTLHFKVITPGGKVKMDTVIY